MKYFDSRKKAAIECDSLESNVYTFKELGLNESPSAWDSQPDNSYTYMVLSASYRKVCHDMMRTSAHHFLKALSRVREERKRIAREVLCASTALLNMNLSPFAESSSPVESCR